MTTLFLSAWIVGSGHIWQGFGNEQLRESMSGLRSDWVLIHMPLPLGGSVRFASDAAVCDCTASQLCKCCVFPSFFDRHLWIASRDSRFAIWQLLPSHILGGCKPVNLSSIFPHTFWECSCSSFSVFRFGDCPALLLSNHTLGFRVLRRARRPVTNHWSGGHENGRAQLGFVSP
jgi:hypothetical protein